MLNRAVATLATALLLTLSLLTTAQAITIGPELPASVPDTVSDPTTETYTVIQTALSNPNLLVSAPSNGTITEFRMRFGTAYNLNSKAQFWVMRPNGGNQYTAIGTTGERQISANSLNVYPVSIPVVKGDLIAITDFTGNDVEVPSLDYIGGNASVANIVPTLGVPTTFPTSLPESVTPVNAEFVPDSSPPAPDTTAPTINLTSPGSKSTYRRLAKVSLTTEPGASVEMALLKCLGSKCTASAGTAGKSKGRNEPDGKGKDKCRALVKKSAKKGEKKTSFYYFGGRNTSCLFDKVKTNSKNLHSISIDSSGRGTFKLAGKLRGKKNKKGLATPGSYILYVQTTDASGNAALETKRLRIKRGR